MLQKNEMAKLVALHDAGAMEDLKQVTEEFKATRTKKRQLTYAVAHQGYGTTTAEADSASANPDVDDDEVFSPLVNLTENHLSLVIQSTRGFACIPRRNF